MYGMAPSTIIVVATQLHRTLGGYADVAWDLAEELTARYDTDTHDGARQLFIDTAEPSDEITRRFEELHEQRLASERGRSGVSQ